MPRTARPPLRYRFPNPPVAFVGRERDAARLAASVDRGPLTLVSGAGGIGKSALVAHALADRSERGVWIVVRPDDPLDQLRLELARVLAGIAEPAVRFEGTLDDPDLLATLALEHAEQAALTVVVDDLHRLSPEPLVEWLGLLADYARHSRWIGIARTLPALPGLAEQTLSLGPLEQDALHALARACAPEAEEARIRAAVASSGGSPFQLRQLLAEPTALAPAVGLLDLPLPREAFERLLDGLPVERLQAAGLVVADAGGLRLHDEAKAALVAVLERDASARARAAGEVASRLEGSDSPEALFESAKLAVDARDFERLGGLLDAHLDALSEAGHGARLWALLRPLGPEVLTAQRLILACRLSSADAVAWAAELPPPTEPAVWLEWLVAQRYVSRFAVVEAAEPPPGVLEDPVMRFEAGIQRVRARMSLGRFADGLALGDRLEPTTPAARALREVLCARLMVLLGDFGPGLRRLAAVLEGVDALPEDARIEVLTVAANLYLNAGRIRSGAQTHQRLDAIAGKLSLASREGRSSAMRRSIFLLESGRLTECAESLDGLGRVAGVGRVAWGLTTVRLKVGRGELEGAEALIDELLTRTRLGSHAEFHAWTMASAAYLAIALGRDRVDLSWPPELAEISGPPRVFQDTYRWIHALRWGGDLRGVNVPWEYPIPSEAGFDLRIITRLARAENALFSGDPDGSVRWSGEAVEVAERHGWRLFEVEARAALCEACLVAGRLEALEAARQELQALAAELPSPRFVRFADFFGLALAPRTARELEAMIPADELAPVVARRLRLLLDERARGDRLDAWVVAALLEAQPELAVRTFGAIEGPSWGYDALRAEVWLPGDRLIPLGRRVLFGRILEALARAGGEIGHEALAEAAWDVAPEDFHPLDDTRRMHVAIRRLRKLIEDDPSAPTRLVTVEGGYAIGSAEPFRVRLPGP